MKQKSKIKVTVLVTNAEDENIEKLIDLPNTEEKIKDILNEIGTDETKYRWGIRKSNCNIFNRNVGESTDLFEFNAFLSILGNLLSIEQIKAIIEFNDTIPISLLVKNLFDNVYEFYEHKTLDSIDEIAKMGFHQTEYGVIKEDVSRKLYDAIVKWFNE